MALAALKDKFKKEQEKDPLFKRMIRILKRVIIVSMRI